MYVHMYVSHAYLLSILTVNLPKIIICVEEVSSPISPLFHQNSSQRFWLMCIKIRFDISITVWNWTICSNSLNTNFLTWWVQVTCGDLGTKRGDVLTRLSLGQGILACDIESPKYPQCRCLDPHTWGTHFLCSFSF